MTLACTTILFRSPRCVRISPRVSPNPSPRFLISIWMPKSSWLRFWNFAAKLTPRERRSARRRSRSTIFWSKPVRSRLRKCRKQMPRGMATGSSSIGMRIFRSQSPSMAVLPRRLCGKPKPRGLRTVSDEIADLAERARAGKLGSAELKGGSFSISNLGMFGVNSFRAIINPPEAMILAVGQGIKQFLPDEDGNPKLATVMRATLSCDHRVVDGALGAVWLLVFQIASSKTRLASS